MKTKALHNQLTEWRHDLHMNPQISFEEEYATNKVANLMKEFWGAVKGFERKSFENNTLDGVRDVATFPIHKRTP